MGLQWADLYPSSGNGHNGHNGQAKTTEPKPVIKAIYDYKDESGNLLYQSVRYDPKSFRQRQPDGKGGWIWSMKEPAVRLVPYRLPELLTGDPARWVFITEGEKDVDNLAAVGMTATTNVAGAGKWRSEYAEHLRGRLVCILPDNDKAGVEHAQEVAQSLVFIATEVRILRLPNLPPKGDVSDWLQAGGDAMKLLGLVASAPVYTPKADKAPKSTELVKVLADNGFTFRLNESDDSLEVNHKRITDVARSEIRATLRDLGYGRHLAAAEDAYMTHAGRNSYHPVRAYLDNLSWDGADWITALAACFTDTPHNVFDLYLRKWLRGAVARAYTGTQNAVLVLDGAQGIGKSQFARWLCPLSGMFIDRGINPDSKDDVLTAMTHWIWEIGELGSTTRRADIEALKGFLSRETFTIRPPYAHFDVQKPALASFIGTVNNSSGIFSDPTGNRRFWATSITAIDWGYSTLPVDQIWAQAAHEYRAGEPWVLTPEEHKRATEVNTDFDIEDPIENLLRKLFTIDVKNATQWTATIDILLALQGGGLQGNTRANQMALSATMKRMGLERKQHGTVRGYVGIW
jgi:hypothetical protein